MASLGNTEYQIEGGTDRYLLEDSSGVLLIDIASGVPNNYQFVQVGDGLSTGEKVR